MKEAVAEKIFKKEVFSRQAKEIDVRQAELKDISLTRVTDMIECKIKRDAELLSPSSDEHTHI